MNTRIWQTPAGLPALALGFAAFAAFIGCQSSPPETNTELRAGEAVGTSPAIVLHIEGGPDDEPDDPGALTLTEAVRLAVMTDPGIQAALARVRIALADAKQARMLPNPILNLAVRFPEGGGKPAIEASLMQDLISILKIPGQSSAADNRLRQASAGAVTTTIDVVSEVQERYVSAQALEHLLPGLEQRQALVERTLDLARSRLSAGEGIREDVTVLESQRVELQVEIDEATQQLRDERLRLARLIGRPSGAAAWSLEPWNPPTLTDTPEGEWIEIGMRSRPEVQESAWKLAALGDDRALASLLIFEGLSAGAEAQRDPDWETGPAISVPVPIFDTGQARAERVTAEQVEARHELVQARRQVIEDIRRALESLARSRENARRVHQELIPLQEHRRAAAEASFKIGNSDATALLRVEQDLQEAQSKAVELDRKTAVAAIRLQRAAGGPGPAAKQIAKDTGPDDSAHSPQ